MSDLIDAQKAVGNALKYLMEMIGEIESPSDFTLERFVLDKKDDKNTWVVTLGYVRQQSPNSISVILGQQVRRYKVVRIDAKTGRGISIESYSPLAPEKG